MAEEGLAAAVLVEEVLEAEVLGVVAAGAGVAVEVAAVFNPLN